MINSCGGILFSNESDKVLMHATTWMNIENNMLNEDSYKVPNNI
jgi:hypothetical protein